MTSVFATACVGFRARPRRWLVTGAAGFIGSNLVEALLGLDQEVVGLDNFATGYRRNLEEALASNPETGRACFRFVEGDVRDPLACADAVAGCDIVLHQAALGSVPRSLADPVATNATNVDGFLNMLTAARDAGVGRFIYASSSSVYGDHAALPKREKRIGRPLSPYAVTKYVNELYAEVFVASYGLEAIGLRYFNVFGPRQDPNGAYAAVIPKWIAAMLAGAPVVVNGDGETSRDFCYVANAVQANLLAAATDRIAGHAVCNIAVGERTSLNELFEALAASYRVLGVPVRPEKRHVGSRAGDVRHSQADIGLARDLLGYDPTYRLRDGLAEAMPWYRAFLGQKTACGLAG